MIVWNFRDDHRYGLESLTPGTTWKSPPEVKTPGNVLKPRGGVHCAPYYGMYSRGKAMTWQS